MYARTRTELSHPRSAQIPPTNNLIDDTHAPGQARPRGAPLVASALDAAYDVHTLRRSAAVPVVGGAGGTWIGQVSPRTRQASKPIRRDGCGDGEGGGAAEGVLMWRRGEWVKWAERRVGLRGRWLLDESERTQRRWSRSRFRRGLGY
ncbi:hypothetical protein H2248_000100 [Termitomyces sp. 'cryptogamus']|nr:hypothetical protein H2248_000100 [Termitomyces sp. 'cryptogamus']